MSSINPPARTIITPSMSFLFITRRTVAFVRTILPADPSSWLLLLGATFLFLSHSLRWWPQSSSYFSKPLLWATCTYLMSVPIFAAGVTAYYLGLVGFKKPASRFTDSVLLPVAVGLLVNLIVAFFWFRDIGEPAYFVTQMHGASPLWDPHVLLALAVNLGTGFQFASLGFVLIAAFYVLLSWGRAALPMRLPAVLFPTTSSSEYEHRGTMFFVWMMIGMVFLTWLPEIALAGLVNWIFPHLKWPHGAWTSWLAVLFHAFFLFVFVVLAVGKNGRKMVPEMLRLPRTKYLATAILIPAVIAYVGPLAFYFHARALRVAHGRGKYFPPSPSAFLGLPWISSLWYFVPALVEEMAWRGYLQPRFIRRYGLVRGIFLVGVVWGASHYFWDFNSYMTARDVGVGLVGRLVGTICLSYVLAWLTIRSESVLPAAVAHAGYNAFLTSRSLPTHNPQWLTLPLWAVTGFVLLRFFPPTSPISVPELDIQPAPEPEPSEV